MLRAGTHIIYILIMIIIIIIYLSIGLALHTEMKTMCVHDHST